MIAALVMLGVACVLFAVGVYLSRDKRDEEIEEARRAQRRFME